MHALREGQSDREVIVSRTSDAAQRGSHSNNNNNSSSSTRNASPPPAVARAPNSSSQFVADEPDESVPPPLPPARKVSALAKLYEKLEKNGTHLAPHGTADDMRTLRREQSVPYYIMLSRERREHVWPESKLLFL